MWTHTHTRARACAQPNPAPLCSCVKWARVLSLGNTPLSQRRSREETHSRKRREERKEGEGSAKIEREGGVTWYACWWVWTWEFAADWRSWAEPLSSFCSSNTPFYWPRRVSRLRSTETCTHKLTIIINCGLIVELLKGKKVHDMLRLDAWCNT